MEKNERPSIKSWIFVLFMIGIPIVGLLYMLLQIFSTPNNGASEIKRDFCIAQLIFSIALIGISLLLAYFLTLFGLSFSFFA